MHVVDMNGESFVDLARVVKKTGTASAIVSRLPFIWVAGADLLPLERVALYKQSTGSGRDVKR